MLIIADKNPENAVKYLIENTNKNFCFKQLIELGQLICSAGISNVYKPIKQGKELQEWIKSYPNWTFAYFYYLKSWCERNINIKSETYNKLYDILNDLYDFAHKILYDIRLEPDTAIFRYKQGYESEYPTNTELPIDICCEEYRKYITEYKFGKEDND